jgi:hypothetical protein
MLATVITDFVVVWIYFSYLIIIFEYRISLQMCELDDVLIEDLLVDLFSMLNIFTTFM